MKTYQEAAAFLGTRLWRKALFAGRATWIERISPTEIGVRYHTTYVVSYDITGTIWLDSDGHRTVTTKRRMNQFSPARIWQNRFNWYVTHPGEFQERPFTDGMTLHPQGIPIELFKQVPLF